MKDTAEGRVLPGERSEHVLEEILAPWSCSGIASHVLGNPDTVMAHLLPSLEFNHVF